MAKLAQVLDIQPQSELRFRGPFTGAPVTSYISLGNPTTDRVYFKIKTTAPKRYCVRPNNGVLGPHESTQIAICLQPFDFDPVEKNKHKFMVQTVIAPEDDAKDSRHDVWKDTHPSQVMDYKLKCIFENPLNNAIAEKSTTVNTTAKSDASTNGRNKYAGDTDSSSPKLLDETEEKLMKAAQEVCQLRVEESQLRQEYLELKEEMIKWRNAAMEKGVNVTSGTRLTSPNPAARNSSIRLIPMTSTSVIIAVLMVIVGYFLGKLI